MSDDLPPQPADDATHLDVNLTAGRDVSVGEVIEGDKIQAGTYIAQATIVAAPAQVGAGLRALTELMRSDEAASAAVTAFQTDFQAAGEQLNLLADYKNLHDLLHKLQFQCYTGIVQAASRFPDDEMALGNLADYQLELESIVAALKEVAAHPSLAQQDLSWVDDLASAKGGLQNAVDTLDPKPLKQAIWRVNRVLANQPARMNSRLNQAARALRLPTLTQALARVCDNLKPLNLDPEKVGQFEGGVAALGELDKGLTVLVAEHDHWQEIDVELRRIENSMDKDLQELEMSWPDLKTKAGPLYVACSEEEAAGFKGESQNLEEALAANNPPKVKRFFRSYRRRAGNRFYRVDASLKDLCERLRDVAGPLASVLRMMSG